MAELVAGVQYGLSSRNSNEKLIVFIVKFTESAFRALEEYSKNASRINERARIKFLQNRGHLSLPVPQDQSSRPQVFNFTVSPNADEETFECLQNKGSRALESFGVLSHCLCIQAKEDVYQATKNRMAEVEEQQKKNRTQVISNETETRGKTIGSAVWPNKPRPMQSNTTQHSRIVTNNHAQKPGNPELIRKPIRDRVIHLLALKPYKKPELYDRLQRDGISEKDKKLLPQMLSQVAKLGKDSTYHIVRGVWNDVQEDWPFYSEQDRQTLKWRKPQNLTPPGSSDTGSSGSGQSPTSTHPGSPPSVVQGAPKRPGYHESVDGIQTKRRRISHFVKPQETTRPIENVRQTGTTVTDNYQHEEDGEVSPVTICNRPCGDNQNVGFDERRNRQPEEESRKKEERIVAAKTVSETKKSNIVASDLNKKLNSNLRVEVKETSDLNNLSDGKLITNDKKPEEKVKRADSPAIVTSSEQQLDNSKYDYSDTRTKYQNSDTIQENTVSASDTVSAPDQFPEDVDFKKLAPIENNAQKRQYVKEFQTCYPEYQELYLSMRELNERINKMNEQRIKCRKSGEKEKFQKINKDIVQKWKENLPLKKKFHYLHNRLKEIKKLIDEYDASFDSLLRHNQSDNKKRE